MFEASKRMQAEGGENTQLSSRFDKVDLPLNRRFKNDNQHHAETACPNGQRLIAHGRVAARDQNIFLNDFLVAEVGNSSNINPGRHVICNDSINLKCITACIRSGVVRLEGSFCKSNIHFVSFDQHCGFGN
jgi:hypothetical protein